jgi:signal transduction histidine kinase
MDVSKDAFDLHELIHTMFHNNRCLMRVKSLEGSCSISVSTPTRVVSDRLKITQILLNYLSNAIKFTKTGGSIGVQCDLVGENIVISVEDTGPGVMPEQQHMLFKRFVQLPGRPHESGTGLGLSISNELAVLLQGRVWYEARQGGSGSRFMFSFPLVHAPADKTALPITTKPSLCCNLISVVNLSPVLIVEDNACVKL